MTASVALYRSAQQCASRAGRATGLIKQVAATFRQSRMWKVFMMIYLSNVVKATLLYKAIIPEGWKGFIESVEEPSRCLGVTGFAKNTSTSWPTFCAFCVETCTPESPLWEYRDGQIMNIEKNKCLVGHFGWLALVQDLEWYDCSDESTRVWSLIEQKDLNGHWYAPPRYLFKELKMQQCLSRRAEFNAGLEDCDSAEDEQLWRVEHAL